MIHLFRFHREVLLLQTDTLGEASFSGRTNNHQMDQRHGKYDMALHLHYLAISFSDIYPLHLGGVPSYQCHVQVSNP